MILRYWVGQSHRWLGIGLTLTILANFPVGAFGPPPSAIIHPPLLPPALLLSIGLYMYFQTHPDDPALVIGTSSA